MSGSLGLKLTSAVVAQLMPETRAMHPSMWLLARTRETLGPTEEQSESRVFLCNRPAWACYIATMTLEPLGPPAPTDC